MVGPRLIELVLGPMAFPGKGTVVFISQVILALQIHNAWDNDHELALIHDLTWNLYV